jgi:hypothetical protein
MPQNFEIKTTFKAVDKATRTIGNIQSKIIRMTAKASMAMRKLDRASSKLTGVVTKGLKWGFAAASGAAIVLFAAVTKTASSMDQLAKKTRAIGFPIEEFQEFQFAAEQSGVSAESFEKSLTKFTKNVGDAKLKTGSLYTTLKKLDPQFLKQVKSTDNVSDAFEIVLDRIQKTPNAAMKAAIATAAFGKAGVDMVNMANLGSDAIEELRNQMRENGIVTAEQAAKAEVFNDAMNRVHKTVGGLLVTVLTPLMPILTDLAERARKWAVENRGIISSRFKYYLEWIIQNFSKVVYYLKAIGKAVAVFYALNTAIKITNASMNMFNTLANINFGPLQKASKTMAEMPVTMDAATKSVGKFQGALMVLGAFAAGWSIGTILHDQLVEPFMKARHQARMLRKEHEQTMSGDLSKRNEAVLVDDLNRVKKIINDEKKLLPERTRTHGYVSGMAALGGGVMAEAPTSRIEKLLSDQERLQRAATKKKYETGPMSDEWSSGIEAESRWTPQVVTKKEIVEVRIVDDSGKAEIVQGKNSPRVTLKKKRPTNLAHTGAMP